MFDGFSQKTSDFLWNLKFNNERPWFLQHKEEFEDYLNKPFKELALMTGELMNARFPGLALNVHATRIYRDARRLYGRGPYKENLWFSIHSRLDYMAGPGFWFEISAASYSRGVGFYAANSDTMDRYRSFIEANIPKMERLAAYLNQQDRFVLEGEMYKRPKKDLGELLNPWYNRKSVSIIYEDNFGGDLLSPDLPVILANDYEFLMPFFELFASFQ